MAESMKIHILSFLEFEKGFARYLCSYKLKPLYYCSTTDYKKATCKKCMRIMNDG